MEQTHATDNDESTWIVQTKRRLVPQCDLTVKDLGIDSSKSVKPIVEASKKKGYSNKSLFKSELHTFCFLVIRFTKDEILSLRKPSKILSSMSEMLDVVSISILDPVCFTRLEPEDVLLDY